MELELFLSFPPFPVHHPVHHPGRLRKILQHELYLMVSILLLNSTHKIAAGLGRCRSRKVGGGGGGGVGVGATRNAIILSVSHIANEILSAVNCARQKEDKVAIVSTPTL